jgi:hypothetical protein
MGIPRAIATYVPQSRSPPYHGVEYGTLLMAGGFHLKAHGIEGIVGVQSADT